MDTSLVKYTTNTAAIAVLGAFVLKKVVKKELLPVSGWKQMLTTYTMIMGSGIVSQYTINEIEKRNAPAPKPK